MPVVRRCYRNLRANVVKLAEQHVLCGVSAGQELSAIRRFNKCVFAENTLSRSVCVSQALPRGLATCKILLADVQPINTGHT